MITTTPNISISLWFDGQAEDAARFYTSVFPDSEIGNILRYGEAGPGPAGSVVTVAFRIGGQEFVALNGGPQFTFTEAVSFVINCTTQEEVDEYWARLTEGGEEQPCGWLKDRFGVSWQVIPARLMELLSDPNPGRAQRATEAMLKMTKIDIAALERAAAAKA
jgi:predicted 3-demethylubiquinone-9 3-methyltransferase (glyoxalase superfamily)